MSSSKKVTCKGTLSVYLSEAQNPIHPPLYTLCYTCIHSVQYTYSHREGGGGLNQREGQWATVHKAGSKIPTSMIVSPKNDEHLPQSSFTGQFFQLTTFCSGVYKVNQSMALILMYVYTMKRLTSIFLSAIEKLLHGFYIL